jgi:hypothetical protein
MLVYLLSKNKNKYCLKNVSIFLLYEKYLVVHDPKYKLFRYMHIKTIISSSAWV